jgi:hypothetical protein
VDVRGVGCYSPHSVVNIHVIYIYILYVYYSAECIPYTQSTQAEPTCHVPSGPSKHHTHARPPTLQASTTPTDRLEQDPLSCLSCARRPLPPWSLLAPPHLHGEPHGRDPSLLRRTPGSVLPCVSRLPCEEQQHRGGGARAEHLPPIPGEEAEADGGHGDPASDRRLLAVPAPTCTPCPPPHVRSGRSNGVGSSLSDRPRSLWRRDRAPWSSSLCWNWKVRDGEGAPLESTRQFLLSHGGPHSLDSLLLRRAPSRRRGASRRRHLVFRGSRRCFPTRGNWPFTRLKTPPALHTCPRYCL